MGLNRAIVAQLVSSEELFIFLRLTIQQSNWLNMYAEEERMSALCPLKKSPSSEALAIQEENKWIMLCWKRHIFTQNILAYLKISTFTLHNLAISHSCYSWGYILANTEVALEYNVIVHEKNWKYWKCNTYGQNTLLMNCVILGMKPVKMFHQQWYTVMMKQVVP